MTHLLLSRVPSNYGLKASCEAAISVPRTNLQLFFEAKEVTNTLSPYKFCLRSTTQMADRAAIEAPFTLASLPKPFDPTVGTTYAAPVFGLRGQKWRKRPEIVASVDGDSITIYNVSAPSGTFLLNFKC